MLRKIALCAIACLSLANSQVQAAEDPQNPEYRVSFCAWVVEDKLCSPMTFGFLYHIGKDNNVYGNSFAGYAAIGSAKGNHTSIVLPSTDPIYHSVWQIDTKKLTFKAFRPDGSEFVAGSVCHTKGTEPQRCWRPSN
jgi:hypothetical protein